MLTVLGFVADWTVSLRHDEAIRVVGDVREPCACLLVFSMSRLIGLVPPLLTSPALKWAGICCRRWRRALRMEATLPVGQVCREVKELAGSTLNEHLEVAGATDPRIVVELNGVEAESALDSWKQHSRRR